jgi:hypothetical protein
MSLHERSSNQPPRLEQHAPKWTWKQLIACRQPPLQLTNRPTLEIMCPRRCPSTLMYQWRSKDPKLSSVHQLCAFPGRRGASTTREPHIYPRPDFHLYRVFFSTGINDCICTGWSYQPVQIFSQRGSSGPDPTHLVQMPHICTGWWLRQVQMWGQHICTEPRHHPVQM